MYKKLIDDLLLFQTVSEQDRLLVYKGLRAICFHEHLSRFLKATESGVVFRANVPFFKTKNYLASGSVLRAHTNTSARKRKDAYFKRRLLLLDLDLELLSEDEFEELKVLMERFSYNPLETIDFSSYLSIVVNRIKIRVAKYTSIGEVFSDAKQFVKLNWDNYLGWTLPEFMYREDVFNYYLTEPSVLNKRWTHIFYKSLEQFNNLFIWDALRNFMNDSNSVLHKSYIPKILPVNYTFKRAKWENKNVHTRTGSRLRYRETVHFDLYKQWFENFVAFVRSYTFFDSAVLKSARSKFELIPNLDVNTYLPKSFSEAVYFFSIYGAPTRKSTNVTKNWLFIFVLLSGFYIEQQKQTVGGFGFELFYRRLFSTHAMIAFNMRAHEILKRENFYSWERHDRELLVVYWFRYAYLTVLHYFKITCRFFYQVTVQLCRYWVNKILSRYYRIQGWYYEQQSYFLDAMDIITDIQLEVTPFFSNNKLSFVWYYCPVWLEAAILTTYVIYSEMNLGSNAWTQIKTMSDIDAEDPYDSSYYLDEVMDQYYDLAVDFIIDYVMYYYEIIFKPILDLFIVLPFWVCVDFLCRLYLSLNGFCQNLWHSVLMRGNDLSTGKVRGRWWKIPLILIRWSFYWVLAYHLLWFFLCYVNFEKMAYTLQPYSPMILNTTEVQFMYVIFAFLLVIRVCGPTFLVSMIKEDWGTGEWFSFAFFSFNWMWLAPAKTIPSSHFFNPVFWESYAIWEDRGQGDFDLEGDTYAIMDVVEVMGWADHRQATAHFAFDELGGGFKDFPDSDYVNRPISMRKQVLDVQAEEAAGDFVEEYYYTGDRVNERGEDFFEAYARNYYNRIDPLHKEWHNPSFERPEWYPPAKRVDPQYNVYGLLWDKEEIKVKDEMLVEYKPVYYELKYNPPVPIPAKTSVPDDFVKERRFRRR